MRRVLTLALLLGCPAPEEEREAPVLSDPVELVPPDLEGVDLPQAFADAFRLIAGVDTRPVWAGHLDALDHAEPGCPDLYLGNPDVDSIDIRTRAKGRSWADYCQQSDGTIYSGYSYWENSLTAMGDPNTTLGRTADATRLLLGDGAVSRDDEMLYEFVGEAEDSLSLTTTSESETWTYTSRIAGVATGQFIFDDSPTPGGFRVGLYRRSTGGDADTLETRGNLYLFEHRIADRFDSFAVDLEFSGPLGAGPDDCTLEPTGWIGLRDEDAFWYDLVFEPRRGGDPQDPEYDNEPYTGCDGCGTLYLRGLEQPTLEVCMDFDFLWDGLLDHPRIQDYAFTLRNLGEAP
ncbi:MAG: hypothetical protein EA397_06825 [Deltaproteobacteria bacterium]|nr:MAG: hypothetical protein EA397_06825 [Deltaproteobacteria bacterium]